MKKRPFLKNVCKRIMDNLISGKSIAEDQVLTFMDELAAEEPKELPDMSADYRKLSSSLCEMWQYREWKELSPEQAFLYGGLWGSVKSYELRYQKNKDEDRMKLLVPKYKDKYWLFRAIKQQPGILHKELAAKGHISPSRLSQVMDDNDMNDLISYRLSGREKYYYLKPWGEGLLDRLKSKEKNVLGSYAEPCKAITVNNDNPEYAYSERIMAAAIDTNEGAGMQSIWAINQWHKVFDTLLMYENFEMKNSIGVNEWRPIQNYTERQTDKYLKNGSKVFLER